MILTLKADQMSYPFNILTMLKLNFANGLKTFFPAYSFKLLIDIYNINSKDLCRLTFKH